MGKRKQQRRFTYGARRIEREAAIGPWENFIGTCYMIGCIGFVCLVYAVSIVAGFLAVLFVGGYVFTKLGLV